MTSLIEISHYAKKFESYVPEFMQFCSANAIKIPAIETVRGQALALMTQPEVRGKKHVDRTTATQFFQQIGLETKDSIQAFNKFPQIGLKTVKAKGVYALPYPFETDLTHLTKRQGASISGDKSVAVQAIKQWWLDNLVNVPVENWQVGHLDPTIGDASERNLAFQPPLQAKYRNRFKWDSFFHRMWPTGDEWISHMDEFHTEAEQRAMLEALKAKFP